MSSLLWCGNFHLPMFPPTSYSEHSGTEPFLLKDMHHRCIIVIITDIHTRKLHFILPVQLWFQIKILMFPFFVKHNMVIWVTTLVRMFMIMLNRWWTQHDVVYIHCSVSNLCNLPFPFSGLPRDWRWNCPSRSEALELMLSWYSIVPLTTSPTWIFTVRHSWETRAQQQRWRMKQWCYCIKNVVTSHYKCN